MNLFATVLTYRAPSANYRGESELNRTVIQKVTDGRFDYPIISPEAMRNALREILASEYRLPCNRERIDPVAGSGKKADDSDSDEKQQLAVRYAEYPDPEKYVDDFFFGYLLAIKGDQLKKLREVKKDPKFPLKRDSVLRMNLAKGLEPYRHNSVFTQSPKFADGNPWTPGGGDAAAKSGLLHRETCVTAFQYPFALNLNECACKTESCKHEEPKDGEKSTCKRVWTLKLLKAIGELNGVAGNHGRSYFEMAPASIVLRLTDSLVAGYRTYCFNAEGRPELIDDILKGDYPDGEFYLGGELVKRELSEDVQKRLKDRGVTLERDPRKLLERVAKKIVEEA